MHVGAIFLDAQGFYGGVKYGFETAAAADHVGLSLIQSNVADDISSEANLLQEMTAAHVQAIIISAASATASVPAIAVASKAGIPVICYNTCINTAAMNKYVYAFALGDPVLFGQLLGQAAGQYFLSVHNSAPQIGIVNCEFVEVCIQRHQGFWSALTKLVPGAKLVANQQGTTLSNAVPIAEAIMRAHPNLSAFFGESGGATLGAVEAVKANGKVGKVVVFGGDMTTQIAQALVSHTILKAEVDVSGRTIGAAAWKLVADAVTGKTYTNANRVVPMPVKLYTTPSQGTAWIAAHANGLP
jgi:ABC-type sugar transport system substrate-binding protein